MSYPMADALKKSRIEQSLSRFKAAQYAGVGIDAWKSYETHRREPSRNVVRNFYARSGIAVPSDIAKMLRPPHAQVLSITSLKGGVGKSPITVDVAACLIARGNSVAVISHDCCYESAVSAGVRPKPNTAVASVDFFGYADLFFSVGEKKEFTKRLRHLLDGGSARDRSGFEYEMGGTVGWMVERLASSKSFEDIKTAYDFVLLDLNTKVDLIRNHAQFVAVIIDSSCPQSVDCAQSLYRRLLPRKGSRHTPTCFGLVTRNDVGGRSRELEELGGLELSPDQAEQLEDARFATSRFRERILSDITAIGLSRLTTHLTNAHEVVIDQYNTTASVTGGYRFFDSVIDIAPHSHAADEIGRLTTELVEQRL